MANEHDVLAAWLKIVRGDTTPSVGLVALTGRTSPAVTWGDPEEADPPVLVFVLTTSPVFADAPKRRVQRWRAEARVARGSLDLAAQMLDRLEAISTFNAFDAEGLDVWVEPGARSQEPPGDAGGYRFVADYRMTTTV